MNKHAFLLLMITISTITGYSQTDSLKISDFKANPTENKYDSIYGRYVQSREVAITHLWKLNFVDADVFNVNLGYEVKLGKLWSSDSYIKFGVPSRNGYYGRALQWFVSHQFKYYYNLNRRERLGRKTNGFSANYISLDIFAGESREPKPVFSDNIIITADSYYGTSLKFGMQRRISNMWFFEPYAGIDYMHIETTDRNGSAPVFNFTDLKGRWQWGLYPVFGIKAGIDLGSFFNSRIKIPRGSLELYNPDSLIHGRKYQERANHLWKMNLVDLGLFMPNLGFEIGLFKNISLESYLKMGVNFKSFRYDNGYGFNSFEEIEFEQQLKYYLNFQRQEQLAENTCGFSGDYLSLGFFVSYYYNDYGGNRYKDSFFAHYRLGIKYGVQGRLGNKGYFDIFAGMSYQGRNVFEIKNESTIVKTTKHGLVPVIGIKVGFILGSGSILGTTK